MKQLLAAVLVVATSLIATPARAEGPTRVMIVGDSVVHGADGDYTWGGTYADPSFDTDHAGRWGMSLWETWSWPSDDAPPIATLMAHDPDVVIEMFGVNDFVWSHLSAAQMQDQLRRFVAEARAVNPEVDVVLSTISQTWLPEVPAFNATLPAVAAELSTSRSRVVATPVAELTRGVDTYDAAHPTSTGERKIAQAVSVALSGLGIGQPVLMPQPGAPGPRDPQPVPEPVAGGAPSAAPAKPRAVRATRAAGRIRVVWRAVAAADRYRVKCGTTRRVVGRPRVTLRARASACRVRSVNAAGVSSWARVSIRAGGPR